MSTESPKEDKEIEEEETTTVTKTITPKGFLGLNFNDPLVLSASLIAGGIFGALIWTMIRNFLFNKPAVQTQQQVDPTKKEVNVTVTPEQLRQAQYNRDVEIAATNMLAKDINTIERNNKQINNYATTPPHYYDQYYNSYARGPTVPVYEDEIEIIDDNAPVVVTQARETYFRTEPTTVTKPNPPVALQVRKPEPQQPQPQQQPESINITSDEEIEEITNNEPDLSKIPPEFINVGNSETAFDKIQPNKDEKKKETEEIDFENLEMDEATLNQMTANAFVASKDDYY